MPRIQHSLSKPGVWLVVAVVCLLSNPTKTLAQAFVELSGGTSSTEPPPTLDSYRGRYDIRMSIGWVVAPNFRVRFDALSDHADLRVPIAGPPTGVPGCPGTCGFPPEPANPYLNQSLQIYGLTANGLLNIDPRGLLYFIFGSGLYDEVGRQDQFRSFTTYNPGATYNELHLGISAGAGIAVPIGPRLHAVIEARVHGLVGATFGSPWVLPITVGLRY